MKNLLFLLLCSTLPITAQISAEAIQKEIDKTVWKPFQKAFENSDGKALNSIYAQQVIRVTPKGIDTKNVFKKVNLERFSENLKNNTKISLDFWFDSRHTNQTTSYEVGFYRIGFTTHNNTKYSYGQFHIVLQKMNDQWKITQDWDTTTIAGKPITATNFEIKAPLKF